MTAGNFQMPESPAILPGATLGVLGSGQLGRMFALAAARLGYRVHVFSPEPDSPTGQVAHRETVADFGDAAALESFARGVSVVTLEFENVPTTALDIVSRWVPVRPGPAALFITQNRLREKQMLVSAGIPCTAFAEVTSAAELEVALRHVGLPAVLKSADWGYDGKGQIALTRAEDALQAWEQLASPQAILEAWVDFECELSVLVARSPEGETASCGPIANEHARHILDLSVFPSAALAGIADETREIGRAIAERLDFVGLCCVELFLTRRGKLLVNEIAPRPHNSGHLTIETCETSQFEQQVRAVCGLPLGSMRPRSPAAMVNLMGELWLGGEPDWSRALAAPGAYLHLYGKEVPQPGRKMGHLTLLAESAEQAAVEARRLRGLLSRGM